MIIETNALARNFKTYQKQEGLWGSVKGFWKRSYEERVALAPTTLQIEQGQIIGLVGANGAGKTTLLKLLSGLIYPSSGTATVMGFTPWERKAEYLRQISILLGQKNQLWWDITPNDSFRLLAEIYDLDHQVAEKRIQELAELLDCQHVLNIQLRRLSLGERMKMEIIGALLHKPRVLFLDEPTIGLDVVAQTTVRKFLADYVKQESPTVILTSHYMDDIARLANKLLLISHGEIVYSGTVDDFMHKSVAKQKITFSLREPLSRTVEICGQTLPSAMQQFSLQVEESDVPTTLAAITGLTGVHDLKLEEADFEDTIHTFLQKESRVR